MEEGVPDLKRSDDDEVAPMIISQVRVGYNMIEPFVEEETLNKIDELDPAWGKGAANKRFLEYEGLLQSEEEKGKRFEDPRDHSVRVFVKWMSAIVYPKEMSAGSKKNNKMVHQPFFNKKNKKAKKKASLEAKKKASLDAKNLHDAILFFKFSKYMNHTYQGCSFSNFELINPLVVEVSERLNKASSEIHVTGVVFTLEHEWFPGYGWL